VAVETRGPCAQKIAELRGQIQALHIPTALVLAEDNKVQHPSTYIRMRGSVCGQGETWWKPMFHPSWVDCPPARRPNRLGFAKWLVSRDNPLTARGNGESLLGFDLSAAASSKPARILERRVFAPSHPELLDWMAVEFHGKAAGT